MLEENALVVATDKQYAWVEIQAQSACGQCAANKGCGASVLQGLFGKRDKVMRVISDIPVNIGDEVIVAVNEDAVLKGSLLVYALPILAMIIFAMLGETLASSWVSIGADLLSITGALIGLTVSVIGLRWYSKKAHDNTNYQPVILRRVINAGAQFQYGALSQNKMLS
jgi:sigma-E factor negative regulatory protein RseC